MSKRFALLTSLLGLIVGTACGAPVSIPLPFRDSATGASSESTAPRPGPAVAEAPRALPTPVAPAAARAAAPATAGAPADTSQAGRLPGLDRMIIRTVNMTISVGNVQDAYREVERVAAEQGGLIASSQIRQDGDRTSATVTVRVPADPATYQATLERLRAIADRVVEEQSQAQDITEEYVDLDSRLRNLRASEDSLLALLSKAQRIEDIIQIQRELTNVRGQIEQIQGRKQVLERRADMATIVLQIREAAAVARGSWSPGDTAAEALRALLQAFRGVAIALIWLVVWLPLWGAALAGLWLLGRFGRSIIGARRGPAAA